MKPAAFTDEEWEADVIIWESAHVCAHCGEDIHVTDEIFLLQVVYAGYDEQGNFNHFILQNSEGDYIHEPQFFHLGCWEDLWEDFELLIEDMPPLMDPEPHLQIAECYGCKSSVRAYETAGLLSFGELRRSRRSPDGDSTIYFDPCNNNNKSELICIACLFRLNDELFEMWDDLGHNGVCEEGLHERCWRNGTCTHGCHRMAGAAE